MIMKAENKKIILITGASSGIGKDSALKLIHDGHIVYGAARRVKPMKELVKSGGFALELDVTDETQIKKGIHQIIGQQGKIDVLINNAGYGLYGAVEDIPIEDAKRQFEVNLFGLAKITQQVLPFMRKAGSGKVINVSSMGGKIYTPLGAWYHASKHALEGWSDCLRLELKQYNIDVIVIEPGIIATEFGHTLYNPMLEHSGKGPYAQMAVQVASATKNSYDKKGAASPASVISRTISKAIYAKKPKTRYRVGKFAKPLVWARLFLGDRIFDWVVMSQVG
jgi:short-subunit dehydrogenase